jgi:hypothetical protein
MPVCLLRTHGAGQLRQSERVADDVIALARDDETRNRMERLSSNQVQPGGDQVQPTIWNLLAQAPGTDLEMLKRIQELDPIEKPDDTQEP